MSGERWGIGDDNPAVQTVISDCEHAHKELFEFVCPRQWANLTLMKKKNVRWCNGCRQRVYFVRTDAEYHAQRKAVIASPSR